MRVLEVYARYRIMPSLQMHQLRVAAVGKLVCDAYTEPVDTKSVVLACLFHDMGNIIKFDLARYPEFVEPEGLSYWADVQREFREKYGDHAHPASRAIGKEIGLSDYVLDLVDNISISKLAAILESGSVEQKIVEYADDRVGPHGVLSIQERFIDMIPRYAHRYSSLKEAHAKYAEYMQLALSIEAAVLSKTTLRPEDIHDMAVAALIEELKHFQVR